MFDSSIDVALPEWVIKSLNPCSILQSFSRLDSVTIALNEYFNTFDIYRYDKERFFLFLRDLVREKKITRYQLSFFRHHKEDKVLTSIHKNFPLLKRRELTTMIEELKKDPPMYARFAEMWGLEQPKKKKLTKKEIKEIGQREMPKPISKKVNKSSKQTKTANVQPLSFNNWKSGFGNQGENKGNECSGKSHT